LNLVHYYLIHDVQDEKDRLKLTQQVTGPLRTKLPPKPISDDPFDNVEPPYWWVSDEEAGASSVAAMNQVGRGR